MNGTPGTCVGTYVPCTDNNSTGTVTSIPSSPPAPPAALAHTGLDLVDPILAGLLLIAAGVAVLRSKRGERLV